MSSWEGVGAGETAFNPLGARGSAESGKEVGTSTPGGQMRKLRHGDAPSCERERTLRLDLPSTWCAHSASTLRICRRGRERRTPEGGVVRGSGSRRGSAGARLSDFPARSRAAPPTGGPSPSSARPKPQHPQRPRGTPPAPGCLLSGGRSPAAPLGARGEQGRAARPPATIPRPQTRRRDSPKVAARRRRSRHSDPALAPAVAPSHRGPGPGGAAPRAPGRAHSPRGPGLNFGAQSRGGTRRSLRNRWPEPARPSAAPSPPVPRRPRPPRPARSPPYLWLPRRRAAHQRAPRAAVAAGELGNRGLEHRPPARGVVSTARRRPAGSRLPHQRAGQQVCRAPRASRRLLRGFIIPSSPLNG